MSAENEADDILDAKISAADWCEECQVPIGLGECTGCLSVAASCDLWEGDDDA